MNEAIQAYLNPGETMIWSNGNAILSFVIPGKSTIGAHIVCITSKGKMIIHDEGGFFGKKQTFVWDLRTYPLTIDKDRSTVSSLQVWSVYSQSHQVSLRLTYAEYVTLVKSLSVACFAPSPQELPMCVEENAACMWKLEATSFEANLLFQYYVTDTQKKMLKIPFSHVKSVELTSAYTLSFEGYFYGQTGEIVESFTIFSPDQERLKEFQLKARQAQTIYSVLGQSANPYRLDRLMIHDQTFTQPMAMGVQDQTLRIVNTETLSLVDEIQLQSAGVYLNREHQIMLIKATDGVRIIKVSDPLALAFVTIQLGKTNHHLSTVTVELAVGADGKETEAYLAGSDESSFLIGSNTGLLISSIEHQQDECYLDEKHQRVLLVKPDGTAFKIQMNPSDTEHYLKRLVGARLGSMYAEEGLLAGIFAGKHFDQENVDVLVLRDTIRLLGIRQQLMTAKIMISELRFMKDLDRLFIVYGDQISMLSNVSRFAPRTNSFTSKEHEHDEPLRIGYTADGMPVNVELGEAKLRLKQASTVTLTEIDYGDIRNINVDKRYEGSDFVRLSIAFRTQSGASDVPSDEDILALNVHASIVEEVIYQSYHRSKARLLPQVSADKMLASWGRNLNDYALYQCFSGLYALYEGAKEIVASPENKEQKHLQLVNALYYGLQTQKQRMDLISVYMPAFFQQSDQVLLDGLDVQLSDQMYRKYRSSLISTFNHLNRYLHEMESSLSAVSFAIIPREDAMSVHTNKAKRGMMLAGGGGLAAAALGFAATGGLGLLLVLPSVIQGVNAYYGGKDAAALEQVRLANEQHRLDFFVSKVWSTFQHVMENMMPYFISEINRFTYQYYSEALQAIKASPNGEQLKPRLLDELAKHYTYKQLPIDESVVVSKRELTEIIHETVNKSAAYIQELSAEVETHV